MENEVDKLKYVRRTTPIRAGKRLDKNINILICKIGTKKTEK